MGGEVSFPLCLCLDGFDLGGGEPGRQLHKHIGLAALGVDLLVHFVQFGGFGVGLEHLCGVFPDGELDRGLFAFLNGVAEVLPALESVNLFGEFDCHCAVIGFDLCEVTGAFEDALLHEGEGFVEDDLGVSHGVYLLCFCSGWFALVAISYHQLVTESRWDNAQINHHGVIQDAQKAQKRESL